uniref:Dr1-associated corepressor n=1 Tax=Sinocyclocheilus anshuiensis TaxID=1608454 RepID=A0A671M143_9TELE
MPGQKRKYNVRFPPGRIKKIMQKDTEVGRIATAVPVIISKALEMFLRSLLTMTCKITQSRNSRVMSINHMKQCIHSEKLFDFLNDLADQFNSTEPLKGHGGGFVLSKNQSSDKHFLFTLQLAVVHTAPYVHNSSKHGSGTF